jgi:type VI secretion system protein ImpG
VSREHFEQMLDYYQQEMMYLRRAGARFVTQYPRIAQNLNISATGSSDPHVQRLLESFAFLTGRLQRELDNRYIQFTNTLLGVLYPQFVSPFPSAAIASFRLSPYLGKTTAGYSVPRGTPLFTEAQEKKICRFQTCYPVELWPLDVSGVHIMNVDQTPISPHLLQTQWVLKIRVRRYDGNLSELDPSFLRFFIAGDPITSDSLYESIFSYLPEEQTPVFLQVDTASAPIQLPEGSLVSVGFEPDEALVPYPHKSLDAYRLLHEFFVFPDKFKFLNIQNISTAGAKEHMDFYIPLADRTRADQLRINASNFVLGCTPIINLFPKITEPIDLNYQSVSYRLIGDQRNEDSTEIHTILKVVGALEGGKTEIYNPYFSFDYDVETQDNGLFWDWTRTPCESPDIEGSDVLLSFVDYNFNPQKPNHKTIYAYTLCTNRDLASYVQAGGALQVDGVIPSTTITCLERPTAEISPSLDGSSQWQLISQLRLNHLSLSEDKKSILALKELLQLYSRFNRNTSHPEINNLAEIKYEPVMRRRKMEAWRGFIQGLSITLSVDAVPYSGQGAYLLSCVLNEFFSLYTSINSFTELTLVSTQTDGIWKKWPAQIGSQPLL